MKVNTPYYNELAAWDQFHRRQAPTSLASVRRSDYLYGVGGRGLACLEFMHGKEAYHGETSEMF